MPFESYIQRFSRTLPISEYTPYPHNTLHSGHERPTPDSRFAKWTLRSIYIYIWHEIKDKKINVKLNNHKKWRRAQLWERRNPSYVSRRRIKKNPPRTTRNHLRKNHQPHQQHTTNRTLRSRVPCLRAACSRLGFALNTIGQVPSSAHFLLRVHGLHICLLSVIQEENGRVWLRALHIVSIRRCFWLGLGLWKLQVHHVLASESGW